MSDALCCASMILIAPAAALAPPWRADHYARVTFAYDLTAGWIF